LLKRLVYNKKQEGTNKKQKGMIRMLKTDKLKHTVECEGFLPIHFKSNSKLAMNVVEEALKYERNTLFRLLFFNKKVYINEFTDGGYYFDNKQSNYSVVSLIKKDGFIEVKEV
jgi:hypothetical protein